MWWSSGMVIILCGAVPLVFNTIASLISTPWGDFKEYVFQTKQLSVLALAQWSTSSTHCIWMALWKIFEFVILLKLTQWRWVCNGKENLQVIIASLYMPPIIGWFTEAVPMIWMREGAWNLAKVSFAPDRDASIRMQGCLITGWKAFALGWGKEMITDVIYSILSS